MNGEPQQCKVGQSSCPIGYTCQRSRHGTTVCCTAVTSSKNYFTLTGVPMARYRNDSPCAHAETQKRFTIHTVVNLPYAKNIHYYDISGGTSWRFSVFLMNRPHAVSLIHV